MNYRLPEEPGSKFGQLAIIDNVHFRWDGEKWEVQRPSRPRRKIVSVAAGADCIVCLDEDGCLWSYWAGLSGVAWQRMPPLPSRDEVP